MNKIWRPVRMIVLTASGLALTEAAPANDAIMGAVVQALRRDPAFAAPILGNITLPGDASALNGLSGNAKTADVRITWHSSDPAMISDTDRGRGPDAVLKGAVKRGAADRRVRLTATVSRPDTVLSPYPSTSP